MNRHSAPIDPPRRATARATARVLLLLAVVSATGVRADDPATAATTRNVYVADGAVRMSAPVGGDWFGAGGKVTLNQPVRGDALAAGGSVAVRAAVGDDLRVAGGDVSVDSTVGGELLAAGGNVAIGPAARIGGDATIGAGTATLEGRIDGVLKVRARRIVLDADVRGDADLAAEQIELGPRARVGGSLRHASRAFVRDPAATVAGAVTTADFDGPPTQAPGPRPAHGPGHDRTGSFSTTVPMAAAAVAGYTGLLGASALLLLLFPGFADRAPDAIRRTPGKALAIGLGVLVGVPVLAVLLFVSLLGIPLAIAVLVLYPLLLLLGYLAGVLFLAQRIRGRLAGNASPPTFARRLAGVAVALALALAVGLLPFVGALAALALVLVGLGACVLEWRRGAAPATPTAVATPV